MTKTATLTEIADQIRIARTTLAEWKNQFEMYIPTVGEGRGRRYIVPDALEVFQSIARLKQADTTQQEIAAILQRSVPITVPNETEQSSQIMSSFQELTLELRRSNDLKEKELEVRQQELEQQRAFRISFEEYVKRNDEYLHQTLSVLAETKIEPPGTAERTDTRKWYWPFKVKGG